METYEYEVMRLLEDTYWWYRGLHQLVSQNAYLLLNKISSPKILDAGCGTGGNLKTIKNVLPNVECMGIDIHPPAVELALQRGVGKVQTGSVEQLPFSGDFFDLVLSLDVLVTRGLDDRRAISEFHRVLKKNGALLLNLAAFDCLSGAQDLASHADHRYTKHQLHKLLDEAGFSVTKLFYWNTAFFPFLAVWRPLTRFFSDKASPRSDLRPIPSFLNRLLTKYILCEVQVAQQIPFPFGSSVFAIAHKR